MDADAKKHALRLVPYGLYLAGAKHTDGSKTVSLVSWFTQTSFDPPLVVLGMHRDSAAFAGVKETGVLALNFLGSDQDEIMKSFFKHVECNGKTVGPLEYEEGPATGCPILPQLPASLELEKREISEIGDHASVIFEVVEAHVHNKDARPLDHATAKLHYAG
jgi:flavin reductase (DIM6/NTAB) family NADH-FMN oxidoreductase RutF